MMNMGSVDPFEATRKYLDDRHRRRQDRTYREREEERRLSLENEHRELELIQRRLELARADGLPESVLRPLVARIVGSLVEPHDQTQHRREIEGRLVEIRELEPGGGTPPLRRRE
jgi:hypothetical protein